MGDGETNLSHQLKQISAEWTGRIVARTEPFVQAGRVEFLLACSAD